MDNQTLWQAILDDLQLQVSKVAFQTFLSQTKLVSFDGKKATINCRGPMIINLIEKRYSPLIKKLLDNYTKSETELVFTAKTTNGEKNIEGPLFTMKLPQGSQSINTNIILNPDYTFKNFAVSSSNQMAYAAATAVANSPGSSYNPLFIYGGVGVGKTHLMQAIGHFIIAQKPKTKIIYCTGEEFTNEMIEAISTKTTGLFKKKYRHVNMLFIDDVQFIAGKYSIQEEFFHTFNAIQQVKGQIVLTSDRPPEEINKLEARLASRFQGGLTIDIGPPDFELRTAIILIKAKQRGIDLPIDLAKLISANIEDNRKLEGVFIRVITESQTKKINIDVEMVKSILGKTIKEIPKKNITSDEVVSNVATYFDIKPSQLRGIRRDKFLSLPRQILYYILRIEVGMPLMEIGEVLGGRDHTTILHGVRKISQLISTDEKIRGDILGIKNKIFG